jgi:hypothetical protein
MMDWATAVGHSDPAHGGGQQMQMLGNRFQLGVVEAQAGTANLSGGEAPRFKSSPDRFAKLKWRAAACRYLR